MTNKTKKVKKNSLNMQNITETTPPRNRQKDQTIYKEDIFIAMLC